jgi:hypothetical protein
MGKARESVMKRFPMTRLLEQYLDLFVFSDRFSSDPN